MNRRAWGLAVVGAILLAAGCSSPKATPLVVYCAAGLRLPVEEIAKEYEAEYGVPIDLQFAGSHELLNQMSLSNEVDLYIPADDDYVQFAREKNLIAETIPVAELRPMIALHRDDPRRVATLDDLLAPGVRVSLADPDRAAIGRLTRQACQAAGKWAALEKHATVFKPTVNDVANDVKLKAVDAGVVWDSIVAQMPSLRGVPLEGLDEFRGDNRGALARLNARVQAAVAKASGRPTEVLKFARFLASSDRGLPRFEKHGFRVADGDAWAERPRLVFYAGAMLRPAIEKVTTEFAEREGVEIDYQFNGCGILCAQMKVTVPDAYFACDSCFVTPVADLFLDPQTLSTNKVVLAVHKGNPKGLKTLVDLAREGVRLGIGDPERSALGQLTARLFTASGRADAIRANVVVENATGDLLVNQLRAGGDALDAILVYRSNLAGVGGEVESFPVDFPEAIAVQPFAVAKNSRHKQLAGRLLEAIRSARGQFEVIGFGWAAP